jgi:hypothetical protein
MFMALYNISPFAVGSLVSDVQTNSQAIRQYTRCSVLKFQGFQKARRELEWLEYMFPDFPSSTEVANSTQSSACGA